MEDFFDNAPFSTAHAEQHSKYSNEYRLMYLYSTNKQIKKAEIHLDWWFHKISICVCVCISDSSLCNRE